MSRFLFPTVLAGLALVVLPLTLACTPIQTGGEECKVSGRSSLEQNVVYFSMEWAYDKVDFGFCHNQKCFVQVQVVSTTECDIPDVRACVIRHIQAANGLVVDKESEATMKLTSTIDRIFYNRDQPLYGPDKEIGEFKGSLCVTELGPGAVTRVFKLYAIKRKAD